MQPIAIAIFDTFYSKPIRMENFKEKLTELTTSIEQKEREIRNLKKSLDALWEEFEEMIHEQETTPAQQPETIVSEEVRSEEVAVEPEPEAPAEPLAIDETPSEEIIAEESQEIPDVPTETVAKTPETFAQPAEESLPEEPMEASSPEPKPVEEPVESTLAREEIAEVPATNEEIPSEEALMDSLEEESQNMMIDERPTVQEQAEPGTTVADRVGLQRVKDLKKAMGINERFLFANELFGGDMNAFTQAVQELNHISSRTDADRMMNEQLASKYRWDEDSEVTESFRNLVARRFV